MPKYLITGVGHYVYMLVLNSMLANSEDGTQFGPFDTLDAARAFYNAELVELYIEEGPDLFNLDGTGLKKYHKTFRKGGPLELYNPLSPTEWETPGPWGHGCYEVLDQVTEIKRTSPAYV